MGSTALQKALQGDTKGLSENQAKGALQQAVGKLTSMGKRAAASKEAALATGGAVVHTAEAQASTFGASMAEGYFGRDKMEVGGVDLRAPVALAAVGYGLYETFSSAGDGGAHALAVGNGVLASLVASVGVRAGQKLAAPAAPPQDGAGGGTTASSKDSAASASQPVMRGELAGPVREVLLTPEPGMRTAGDGGETDERRRRRRPRRFPGRAERAED